MSRRQGPDASFLIGAILGVVIGAAIAVILAEATQGDKLNLNDTEVKQALASLEAPSDSGGRMPGASEGVANQ
jgi:gas vesicle protein